MEGRAVLDEETLDSIEESLLAADLGVSTTQDLLEKLKSQARRGEGGDVLIGEVSTVNDDLTDNIFREPIGRFAEIDEDVAPTHLLVSDYDRWL